MKIRHKINHGWTPPNLPNVVWSERVEREAAATTDAAEHAWRRAQERLLRAQRAVRTEQRKQKPQPKRLTRLRRIVEARREELAQLDAGRRQAPAGSQHRGTKSYRGIGTGHGNIL